MKNKCYKSLLLLLFILECQLLLAFDFYEGLSLFLCPPYNLDVSAVG